MFVSLNASIRRIMKSAVDTIICSLIGSPTFFLKSTYFHLFSIGNEITCFPLALHDFTWINDFLFETLFSFDTEQPVQKDHFPQVMFI